MSVVGGLFSDVFKSQGMNVPGAEGSIDWSKAGGNAAPLDWSAIKPFEVLPPMSWAQTGQAATSPEEAKNKLDGIESTDNRSEYEKWLGGYDSAGASAVEGDAWSTMSDQQKSDYFSGNPTVGKVGQGLLSAFGLTSLGKAVKGLDPRGWENSALAMQGYDPAMVEAGNTGMTTNAAGQTVSNNATIGMQDASNFGAVSTSLGLADISAANGIGTLANGTTISNDATIAAQDAAAFGGNATGGGDVGSGKVVCTAMNQAYGFGSFRQAVWLKYADKHLTKAHEAGYHAMFIPLVKYAFNSGDSFGKKMLRSILEHGTRHRTADLRAEMYNRKRDALGRIYRAFFEPLCYVVGKLKGF